jgi:hypothetical protein
VVAHGVRVGGNFGNNNTTTNNRTEDTTMTMKQYAAKVMTMALKHPDALVVCAGDDEGNSFHPVMYVPTLGTWNEQRKTFEWVSEDGRDEDAASVNCNAVCIN